jgi:hypothetical protein
MKNVFIAQLKVFCFMEMKCGQRLEQLRSKIMTAEFHYLRCLQMTMEKHELGMNYYGKKMGVTS